jgi:ubiquinone/menaquinone biosynthesis C-methylase UbiE
VTSTEQKHFNERAAGYETEIGEEYAQALKWQLIEKYSETGQTVIDVGGANGRHAVDLSCLGRKVICVDLSPGMLKQMCKRKEFLAITQEQRPIPVVSAAQSLPITNNSADMAYCFATLLLMPDQGNAIAELVRTVKPGGYIILDIARPWNIGWLYWRNHYKKIGFPGIFPLSAGNTRKLFRDLRCTVIESIATGFLSQLLYLPFVESRTRLRSLIHSTRQAPDLDGKISARIPTFANREYIVLQKAFET